MRLTLDQTSYDYLQRARGASERGKALDAVDNYKRVLKREGGYFAPANLELSYVLMSLKRNDEALQYLERARRRINDPEAELHIAEVQLALGRKDDALATLKEAQERYPENADLKKRLQSLPN